MARHCDITADIIIIVIIIHLKLNDKLRVALENASEVAQYCNQWRCYCQLLVIAGTTGHRRRVWVLTVHRLELDGGSTVQLALLTLLAINSCRQQ